jgi:putative SOS response-associated peptidase YedK
VRLRDGEREFVASPRGLVLFWAKDPAIGNKLVNTRAETIAGNREATSRHRSLMNRVAT